MFGRIVRVVCTVALGYSLALLPARRGRSTRTARPRNRPTGRTTPRGRQPGRRDREGRRQENHLAGEVVPAKWKLPPPRQSRPRGREPAPRSSTTITSSSSSPSRSCVSRSCRPSSTIRASTSTTRRKNSTACDRRRRHRLCRQPRRPRAGYDRGCHPDSRSIHLARQGHRGGPAREVRDHPRQGPEAAQGQHQQQG